MKLNDMMPLAKYCEDHNQTTRDTLAKAMAGNLDLFYVFDGMSLVIYEPIDDRHRGKGTENNMVGEADDIEIEYVPSDTLQLTPVILKQLWGREADEKFPVKLFDLIEDHEPEGFKLRNMLDGSERPIATANIYTPINTSAKVKKLPLLLTTKLVIPRSRSLAY